MNPWLIVIAGALFVGGFFFGRDYEQGEQAKVQYDQAVAYAGEIVARQGRVDSLAAALQTEREKKAAKDRIITKEVIRYESTVSTDLRVRLPGAWRLLHDAAATGEPADTASLASGRAEAVTDAAAIETVSENYADCRDWREQVIGWQRFWAEVKPAATK